MGIFTGVEEPIVLETREEFAKSAVKTLCVVAAKYASSTIESALNGCGPSQLHPGRDALSEVLMAYIRKYNRKRFSILLPKFFIRD